MRQQQIVDGSFGREGFRTLPWQGLDYTGGEVKLAERIDSEAEAFNSVHPRA